MYLQRFVLTCCLALLLAGCGGQDSDSQRTDEAAERQAVEERGDARPTERGEAQRARTTPAEREAAGDAVVEAAEADHGTLDRIRRALAGDHRAEGNRDRDRYRNPAATLAFFGLEPDMTVVELWPGGGGWYTEVLAPVLRDEGRLIAAGFPADSDVEYFRRSQAAYEEKLAAHPEVYDRVEVVPFNPPEQMALGEPGSADLAVTFRNLHSWHGRDALPAMFEAAFEVLRPGGVLGVVQHRAPGGSSIEDVEESGYLPQDWVVGLAEDAGFTLDAASDINANPADTGDHPEGVWTLPPSLRHCREMDEGPSRDTCMEKYERIGESDRMTLRFVKPAGEE